MRFVSEQAFREVVEGSTRVEETEQQSDYYKDSTLVGIVYKNASDNQYVLVAGY